MRMVFVRLVIIFFFCLLLPGIASGSDVALHLSSAEKAWLDEHHTVRVRIGSAPPFIITDGEIRGLAIDYLVKIFDRNGINFTYVPEAAVTWPQALKYIAQHEVVDMVPTAKITDERRKSMLFTDEYIFAPWVIFTRSNSDFISSLDDLNGKTVSVEEGFVIQEKLMRDFPGIKLKVVSAKLENYAEIPIRDLSTGVVDAYVGNLLSTTYLIQQNNYVNVKVAAPTPFENHNQAMAIRSDWPELVSIIDKTLAAMTAEEHAAIRNKWLSIRYDYGISTQDVIKWILAVAGVAVFIISFILFWNSRLKSEVASRKLIETDLLEKERELVEAQFLAGTGSWTYDPERGMSKWSKGMLWLWGLDSSAGLIPYEEHKKYIHPDDYPLFEAAVKEAVEHGTPYTLELRIIRPDGVEKTIITNCEPLKDSTGRVCKLRGTNLDITERKLVEEKLRESEERFKALHNASFGGITIHDKGLILECNKGLSEITGYAEDELIGMDGLLLIAPQSRDLVLGNILAGYEKPYEAVGLRKNGEEFPLRLEAREIPYKGRRVRVVEFRDISEYKQYEAEREKLQTQLLQAQKMESVGRLAGGVAHDFNNMLSVILGRTEMVQENLSVSEPLYEDLDEIKKAAERSANLTRQLLAFARKQTIAPKVLDFNNAVSTMMTMVKRLIGEDIELEWSAQADLWSVEMDPSQLDQILANLCVNARDAIAGVGKVTIETENVTFDKAYCENNLEFTPGEYVLLALSDNGCGMDRDTLSHLYEPFFTTKEMGKGTGLGLATVYGIVKQNNGFIKVYSELDQGTTFKIYLPRYIAENESVAETIRAEPLMSGNETILLVEDEPAILKMAKAMLESLGYTVFPANTPGDAIRFAEMYRGQVDLLLTDVVMPEMNGRDLARYLEPIFPDLATLFMSGYTANVIVHHGVLDKGVKFIEKPFSKKDLAVRIREVLNDKDSDQ